MTDLAHLVQDLRASAHRCPDDVRPLVRRAAAALEVAGGHADVAGEISRMADFVPQPAPFLPPGTDPRLEPRRVKGAPA